MDTTPQVLATVETDDHGMRVTFDAAPWLESEDLSAIMDLVRCDWGGDYPADRVAHDAAEYSPAVRALFAYHEEINAGFRAGLAEAIGFEVHVSESQALHWLLAHRRDILSAIKDEYGYDDTVSLDDFVAEYLENVADQQWPEGVD